MFLYLKKKFVAVMAVAEEIAFRSTESPVDPGRHKSNADSSILQLQFKVSDGETKRNVRSNFPAVGQLKETGMIDLVRTVMKEKEKGGS